MKLTSLILNRCLAVLLATTLVSEASLSAFAAQVGVPSPRGSFSDLLNLNPRLGFVIDSYEAPQASKRVVLIQDLHLHYPTQKRILKILEQLYTKHLVQGPVAIEGLNGPYDTHFLANLPKGKLKEQMVDHFMKTGDLSGDEAFSVLRGNPQLLYGVDHADYYKVNRALFQDTYASRMALTAQLSRLQQWVQILKGKHYPRGLKRFSQTEVYDAATAEAALQQKVAWLSANPISNPATQTLVENLIQADHALFFLTRLLNQQTTLDEVRYVAQRLTSFVSTTQALLKTIQTTDSSFDQAPASPVRFDAASLEEVLRASIDFYVMALMRDEPMAANTLALLGVYDGKMGSLEDRKKPTSHLTSVALVAGGFHTAGITKRLKDAGVSYTVITPNLDETPNNAYHTMYVSKLMGRPLGTERSTLRVLSNLIQTPEGQSRVRNWWGSHLRASSEIINIRTIGKALLMVSLLTFSAFSQTTNNAFPKESVLSWSQLIQTSLQSPLEIIFGGLLGVFLVALVIFMGICMFKDLFPVTYQRLLHRLDGVQLDSSLVTAQAPFLAQVSLAGATESQDNQVLYKLLGALFVILASVFGFLYLIRNWGRKDIPLARFLPDSNKLPNPVELVSMSLESLEALWGKVKQEDFAGAHKKTWENIRYFLAKQRAHQANQLFDGKTDEINTLVPLSWELPQQPTQAPVVVLKKPRATKLKLVTHVQLPDDVVPEDLLGQYQIHLIPDSVGIKFDVIDTTNQAAQFRNDKFYVFKWDELTKRPKQKKERVRSLLSPNEVNNRLNQLIQSQLTLGKDQVQRVTVLEEGSLSEVSPKIRGELYKLFNSMNRTNAHVDGVYVKSGKRKYNFYIADVADAIFKTPQKENLGKLISPTGSQSLEASPAPTASPIVPMPDKVTFEITANGDFIFTDDQSTRLVMIYNAGKDLYMVFPTQKALEENSLYWENRGLRDGWKDVTDQFKGMYQEFWGTIGVDTVITDANRTAYFGIQKIILGMLRVVLTKKMNIQIQLKGPILQFFRTNPGFRANYDVMNSQLVDMWDLDVDGGLGKSTSPDVESGKLYQFPPSSKLAAFIPFSFIDYSAAFSSFKPVPVLNNPIDSLIVGFGLLLLWGAAIYLPKILRAAVNSFMLRINQIRQQYREVKAATAALSTPEAVSSITLNDQNMAGVSGTLKMFAIRYFPHLKETILKENNKAVLAMYAIQA